MASRVLHIAAYDISHPKRLRHALKVAKGYASGGQKSVFECYLTDAERQRLITDIRQVVEPSEDRFLLVRLDPRAKVRTMGIAIPPEEPALFYVG